MPEFEIIPYTCTHRQEWDDFVEKSKNGTFLLKRDYMDYHADRFTDNSLIIKKRGKIHSLLPACRVGSDLYSHRGLTYGGLIMDSRSSAGDILTVFNTLRSYLSENGIRSLVYKPVPHIYHTLPSEEDLYALFRLNATLSIRNIASVIGQSDRLKFRNIRKQGIRKAANLGIMVRESPDLHEFWEILSDNLLKKYEATPVHTAEEMIRLKTLFPDNILLYGSYSGDRMIAGVVLFLTRKVAHCQYISASPEGKASGALDLLFDFLINNRFREIRYFDFGTSNEERGRMLNESLIYQKEGFGARGICYDTYTIPISDSTI